MTLRILLSGGRWLEFTELSNGAFGLATADNGEMTLNRNVYTGSWWIMGGRGDPSSYSGIHHFTVSELCLPWFGDPKVFPVSDHIIRPDEWLAVASDRSYAQFILIFGPMMGHLRVSESEWQKFQALFARDDVWVCGYDVP